MSVRLGNAPCSWGVRPTDDPERPTWQTVLKEVAEAGYQGVELGPLGYMTELAPSELSDELAKNGLSCIAAVIYQPFSDPDKWDLVLDASRRLCAQASAQNAPNVVLIDAVSARRAPTVGRADEAEQMDAAEWKLFRDRFETIARMASEEYGLVPGLHQHVGGFQEFEVEHERMLGEIDDSLLKICFDTGHYRYAGFDPVAFLKRHIDRISYVHFKDINPQVHAQVVAERTDFFKAHSQGVFCRLGEGDVDFPSVRRILEEAGYSGWATVEQDADPLVGLKPLEDARQSLDYLRSIGF